MRALLIAIIIAASALTAGASMMPVSADDASEAIARLDNALNDRETYIAARQARIDSLKSIYAIRHSRKTLMDIGDTYAAFINDSALAYYQHGSRLATDPVDAMRFRLKRLAILPLAGFIESSVNDFIAIDSASVDPSILTLYYESGRKLFSYVASFYSTYNAYYDRYIDAALNCQKKLLDRLDHDTDAYIFNLGEYYLMSGQHAKAEALLRQLADNPATDSGLLARACHHLSAIAKKRGDNNAYIYYLATSALSDIRSATLEVISLQELGTAMQSQGDVQRAYKYLSAALDNAVRCGATLRMIESSRVLPIIERSHITQVKTWRLSMYLIITIMVMLVIVLGFTLTTLYRKVNRMQELQESLRRANATKEAYISKFLNLCSIYMDKLNQFSKIAIRKLSTGKGDELTRMLKSGKLFEEQNIEFYEAFDSAILHLYPDFVAEVNSLLRPDARIELSDSRKLNTDVRILALTRMGIRDAAAIAQILNFSINTIYAYRNRLKSRAVNPATFDDDLMQINSAE